MKTSFRANALLCAQSIARAPIAGALLTTTALCAPAAALAQVPDQPIPPVRYNLDANGVDLVTGKYYLSSTDLAIGAGGDHGLTLVRTARELGEDHNFLSAATQLTNRISISIGTRTDEFSAVGQPSLHGTGATLTSNGTSGLVYTTSDGTRYEFSGAYGSSLSQRAEKGRVARVVFPDGRVWTHSYLKVFFQHWTGTKWLRLPAVRLQSVDSNDGYRLSFEYAADFGDDEASSDSVPEWMRVAKVTAVNKAANNQTWPEISYTDTATTRSKTDALGRITTITYDSQDRVTGVKRPSSTTDDVTIGYDAAGRVASFSSGNGLYTYGYSDSGGTRTTRHAGR